MNVNKNVNNFLARQIVLEVDVDCEYEHIYPLLLNSIKAISGEKFDMNKGFGYAENKMMPISRTNLISKSRDSRPRIFVALIPIFQSIF